jgi:tyrosine-specific transport protein
MISKKIGGVLLIVGTSIGAGMLALPVANASFGFWPSTILLVVCWALMTLGALYMTEASLYVARGQHLVTMAKLTLGKPGVVVAWVSYVLLLYALLSAYISGGADVFGGLVKAQGYPISDWISITLFTMLFGLVVYQGIHSVDLLNRALMFGKLAVFVFLVFLIFPHTDAALLTHQITGANTSLVMILITSFGFAIIVPNLRDYFDQQAITLKKIVIIGSLIPLICYIIWDRTIMGAIPSGGSTGLIALQQSDHTTSMLALHLAKQVQNQVIHFLFNFFTTICMLTAFLGVSLSLMSFLSDAFKLEQMGREGLILFILTFLPPWVIVMFYPGAYMHALSYAGSCCVVLLLFLPAWMCLQGRKRFRAQWQVPGGAFLQYGLIAVSLLLLILSFF